MITELEKQKREETIEAIIAIPKIKPVKGQQQLFKGEIIKSK